MQVKRLVGIIVAVAAFGAAAFTVLPQGQEPQTFKTGCLPTPVDQVIAAIKAGKVKIYAAKAAPAQVIVIPKRLSVWGNNKYGVCVTSESCFAISDYSTYVNGDAGQVFVTEAECIEWARKRGYLNGATLLEVIRDMQQDGIKDEKGVVRKAGAHAVVDFRIEDTLKSAIAQGPVSIAIGSGSLPSGAGNKSGWYVFGSRRTGADHCVSLHGYGPTAELLKPFGVTPPANAPANGYLLFTWGTIGVVDHSWLLSTCVEAWVRNPTIVGLDPPNPEPKKIVVTVADVKGDVGGSVKFSPVATGGTSPYIFLFDYGDGSQDASGTHQYKAAGSYKVTVSAIDGTGNLGAGTCKAMIGVSPPPGPGPIGGTMRWIDGVEYEVFPSGTRQRLRDLITPMSP